jgi:hypothetical protein
MKNYLSSRHLILALIFFVVAALLWLTIFSYVGDGVKTPRIEMLVGLSTALAQLVFVAFIGATITFLYNQHAKDKEINRLRIDENNKLRRDLLSSLIDVRAQVEKNRREFRLLPPSNRKEGYKQSIQNLLQARLSLSQVWHSTETWRELYSNDSEKIQVGLLGMKKYLDGLIDEYEANIEDADVIKEESAGRVIAEPPLFTTFVTGDGGQAYTKEFLEQHYRVAAQKIRKHLLSPEE